MNERKASPRKARIMMIMREGDIESRNFYDLNSLQVLKVLTCFHKC